MICASCGKDNGLDLRFCGSCGTALNSLAPTTVSNAWPAVRTEATEVAPATFATPSTPPPQQASPTHVTIINQQGGGTAFNPMILDASDKSPGTAALLSALWVGSGQLYNGQVGKGIVMFFGCVGLWFVLLGWIINLWSIFDAYSVAKRKRHNWHMVLAGSNAGGQVARVGT